MNFEPREPLETYAARSHDDALLEISASGGMFTELAREILKDGGCVVGAGWNGETSCAEHKCVWDEAGLAELRGSKYTESTLAKVYSPMESALRQGVKVLFTGMPCQVAAMRRKFGDDENLTLCGIMCHSIPDPAVWKRYVEELERKAHSKIKSIKFRDKRNGWRNSTFVVEFEDSSRNIAEPLYGNDYARAYFAGYAARESCLSCQFRSGRCDADLILGDFWGVEDHLPEKDDGKGISAILVFSQKGKALFDRLNVFKHRLSYQQVLAENQFLETSVKPDPKRRNRFLSAYPKMDMAKAVLYATEGTLLVRMSKRILRIPRRLVGKLLRMTKIRK